MATVYIVFTGDYSDREARGVYSTRELAEDAANLWNTDQIEEFALDEMPEHPPGCLMFRVAMDRNGNTKTKYGVQVGDWYLDWEYARDQRAIYHSLLKVADFYVWARDKEHAVKIANERRIQLLAENRWGKP